MKICQFNFNNEVDTFEIHVDEETGVVTIPGEGGTTMAEYDSVQQLAENYALARDVKPENLKNWTLLENGNVYSFVLRAGTAGVDVSEVEEKLDQVFTSLEGRYHPLNIARAKEQVMSDGMADLTEALVHCTETDIARDVYDAMSAEINGTEAATVAEEEVDERTELQKYIDDMESVPGAIGFLATLAQLPIESTKEEVYEALNASYVLSNVSSLRALYNNAINDAINEGIGVNNAADALTVITQTVAGTKDDTVKARMSQAARMAGRDKVNVSVDIVGQNHIKHTAELVALADLAGMDLYVRDNVPFVVRFDAEIDAQLEAEQTAQAAQAAEDQGYEEDTYTEEDYEEEYGDGEE